LTEKRKEDYKIIVTVLAFLVYWIYFRIWGCNQSNPSSNL